MHSEFKTDVLVAITGLAVRSVGPIMIMIMMKSKFT